MKNEYEICGEVTVVIIDSPKYGRKEALISTSKLGRAKEFAGIWYVSWGKNANTFYVIGQMPAINGKKKTVYLHRWITAAPKGLVVDHKNHDGLINTEENLRVCTNAENHQNRNGAQSRSKSRIRGVSWSKRDKKWRSAMTLQGKYIHLGCFDDIFEAERAVKEARLKFMPYSKERLEKLRGEMTKAGIRLGFLHPEVLALSQKVDKLHNEYNREKVGK